MMEPLVTKIRIEYHDGSYDVLDPLPGGFAAFYNRERKRGTAPARQLGLHTRGAMACLMFLPVVEGFRREYSSADPEIGRLWKFVQSSYNTNPEG